MQSLPPKKKVPVWVWVLLVVLLLGILGLTAVVATGFFLFNKASTAIENAKDDPAAAAKLLLIGNPDYEVVDGDRGSVRVREKKTGKIVELDLEEVQKGRIRIVGENGEKVDITQDGGKITASSGEDTAVVGGGGSVDFPSWFREKDGCSYEAMLKVDGKASMRTAKFTCDAPTADVAAYYTKQLEGEGFTMRSTALSEGQTYLLGSKGETQASVNLQAEGSKSTGMIMLRY